MKYVSVINFIEMCLCIILINIFFIYELGYLRFIGLIGFMMLGNAYGHKLINIKEIKNGKRI